MLSHAQSIAYLSGKVIDADKQPVSNAFLKVGGQLFLPMQMYKESIP